MPASESQSHGFLPVLPVSSPAQEDSDRGQGALQGFCGTRRQMLGSGLQGWALSRHLCWGHVCHVPEVLRRTDSVGHACRRVSRDQLSREASCSRNPPPPASPPQDPRDRHLENVGSGHRSGCGGVPVWTRVPRSLGPLVQVHFRLVSGRVPSHVPGLVALPGAGPSCSRGPHVAEGGRRGRREGGRLVWVNLREHLRLAGRPCVQAHVGGHPKHLQAEA